MSRQSEQDPSRDDDKAARDEATTRVIDELKVLYREKLMPVEQTFMYNRFYSPLMTDAEFESKPMVLLIGQYSTGKTTFVQYLIGRNFPGQRIGPEPTTDRFTAVVGGPEDRVIPGNALCVSPDLPFRGLEKYGTGFLNHFEGSQCESQVLQNITLVDSPGILAGRKQGERGYDFKEVCGWFAERCDLILLLFDAHKLDISDEFQQTVERLGGHEDKIRCVLNKADQVDRQRLMRVYGALMWGMGKVLRTPEVLRVYIGSFWDQPLVYDELQSLFESEESDLMADLRDLPRNSAVRKINELVKRTRLAKVNAHIVSYLKSQMPQFMGGKKKQQELLSDLGAVFRQVMKQDVLSPGDFPDIAECKRKFAEEDFSKFPKLNKKHLEALESLLVQDIPRLMGKLPKQLFDRRKELPGGDPEARQTVKKGGALYASAEEPPPYSTPGPQSGYPSSGYPRGQPSISYRSDPAPPECPQSSPGAAPNPFAKPAAANPFAKTPPAELDPVWLPAATKAETDSVFESSDPVDGKLTGDAVRPHLVATEIQDTDLLFQVWELSDHDGDGLLDAEEFALAIYLCQMVKSGEALPDSLPADLVPPSHRR